MPALAADLVAAVLLEELHYEKTNVKRIRKPIKRGQYEMKFRSTSQVHNEDPWETKTS